ncbi:glycerophosphodiester phosphodiesterase family protein [Psychrobacter sp. SWN149]|uniref:glycerophosphodiester phosphodiesterase family protein n=1 Tax=Psychrobacter sp. SWN149 TaxID=2792057 RepID=UPI0018CC9E8D|nr:glycerophosphodiester phosphodiesterase family protein [Psychrobacter sp. SWN149]MBH0005804.1 glycerophosphodiester phosphodiesterase [Psychrobacter sp. SWN149]
MTMLDNSVATLNQLKKTPFKTVKTVSIAIALGATCTLSMAADDIRNTTLTQTSNQTIKPSLKQLPKSLPAKPQAYTYGVRPFYLVNDMDAGPLKDELMACKAQVPSKTNFSIAHRGAPLQLPEHTYDSYVASAQMGAGILECDVAFTNDGELVCRHAQDDLHTTTNILATPLAKQCTVPPIIDSNGVLTNADSIECRTSDISASEFKTLTGKMDAANKKATSIDEYMNATAPWRTDLYSQNGKVLTLKEHIALARQLDMKHTPELKAPAVTMPFNGYRLDDYRQQLIETYKAAGVPANDVFPQSFNIEDLDYWIKNEPAYGANAVYLIDDSNETAENKTFDKDDATTWKHSLADIKARGINIIAPALWLLVTTDDNGKMIPSAYAKQAKANDLKIITWSIERSGPLANGGDWYYSGLGEAINNDGDMMNYIDVLAQDVGVQGIFSDWPATVSYYANCKGLK